MRARSCAPVRGAGVRGEPGPRRAGTVAARALVRPQRVHQAQHQEQHRPNNAELSGATRFSRHPSGRARAFKLRPSGPVLCLRTSGASLDWPSTGFKFNSLDQILNTNPTRTRTHLRALRQAAAPSHGRGRRISNQSACAAIMMQCQMQWHYLMSD